ncbi:hypothetical protein PQG67_07070 [Corynebacterium pseudodiphtheriticum]|uniref:hypothetical protein n=1 Tax=Corynebacterium pseudodiphtheriticum TaxID=37637 RepID=UPI00234C7BE9|nr:hypothetical protein [Corynebacterium pseudodiphtheriticum]MDC7086709.1 hypothetical protein [Corynebacterium pseudodiphtheriticum]
MSAYLDPSEIRAFDAARSARNGLHRAHELIYGDPAEINTTAAIRATKSALAMLHEIQEWQERTCNE